MSRTLVDVLQVNAGRHHERRAYAFLRDGEDEAAALTYGAFETAVRSAAARIADIGAAGDRIILLYPQGLDFLIAFLACQWTGRIPVPVSLPNRQRGTDTLAGIVTDCDAVAVLTTRSLLDQHVDGFDAHERLQNVPRFCTDEWLVHPAATPAISPNRIALLQYTSGSTGTPRGVIVTHDNLIDNHRLIERAFGHTADTVILTWLPMFHDMGLGTVLQALWLGVSATLMSPTAFLQQPVRWLRAVGTYGATTTGGPDFAYDLCVRKITDEQRAGLDLRSWRVAYSGAEPVRAATLRRFVETFSAAGFRESSLHPVYGLAEATLFVSSGDPAAPPVMPGFSKRALTEGRALPDDSAEGQSLVSCGTAWDPTGIAIVDAHTGAPVPAGVIGEIWVSGPSVADGYWQRPDDTAATFHATLTDDRTSYLRTGDLGFQHDGQLYITGRLKDLIIIRGRNHYPQDVEATASMSDPALEPGGAAAFSIDANDAERLVVVAEVRRTSLKTLDSGETIRAIRAAVAESHGLHTHAVVLLRPASLPRTSSGKVRRRACRQAFLDHALPDVASWVFWMEAPAAAVPESADLEARTGTGTTTEADALVNWIRDYAARRVNSRTIDERRTVSPHIVLDLGNRGLLGMQVPRAQGGLGLGHADTARVLEQLAAVDLTLCLFVGLNNYLGIRPLLRHARREWQEQWLPRLAVGRELAAFALTEPGAGSNPRAITARAEPDGEGRWRLSGTKIWSGAAQWAGVITVFARQVDAAGRPGGISAFVLRQDTPGLSHGPEALTMGMRGLIQNTVHLDRVVVDERQLLGAPGGGMDVAHDAMMHARLAVGAASIGAMKRCAQLAVRYASRRDVATGRLLAHPVTLERLGRTAGAVTTLDALVGEVARAVDAGLDVPVEAFAAVKALGPEWLWRAVDDLMQLTGGRGYIEPNLVPQLMRDARILRVFEGPTETMLTFLGARLLSDRRPLERLVADILGAPAVAPLFARAADAVRTRISAGDVTRIPEAATHWSHARAGELAARIIALGAATGARDRVPSPAGERAVAWTRAGVHQAMQMLALGTADDRAALSEADAMALAAEYAATIGDVEQTLAFEDHTMDPLLRRDGPVAMPTVEASSAAPIAATADADRLRDWLKTWLAARLHLEAGQINLSRSFADHGLDSLASVELVQELSEFLGRSLDDTLLWNFATPVALVSHLCAAEPSAREASHAGRGEPAVAGTTTSVPTTTVEDELARLEQMLGDDR